MTNQHQAALARVETGVPNLDALFDGGLPKGSVIVFAGPPGSGKTILVQQICFHNATKNRRVVYFNTLSEPVAKTLRYASQFSYFDKEQLDGAIHFIDLGSLLRSDGLDEAAKLIMEQVQNIKPAFVVIDSFKVFNDLAKSNEELRKFSYALSVNFMAWETTTLLIGEYGHEELGTNPLFSIVDSLVLMTQREESGEQKRFIQIPKTRGAAHSLDEHSFHITSDGVSVFAPRVTIERHDRGQGGPRCVTGITQLDALLGAGIPCGSSVLVAGVAGTGKTVLLLEFIYRGALAGERGILFSFEETEERLRAAARGLGWDLDAQIDNGMVELVFIAQPNILVEEHLLMMRDRLVASGARRVAIDSVSVFLHKVKDPQTSREKVFQLATIVQNAGAVGFFATDIPYGAHQISRLGVEETVVDGIFLLSATEEGLERQRYIEVYKLRGTAHLKGRHNLLIGQGGITIFPRYLHSAQVELAPSTSATRLSTGVPALDALVGGGLLERSATLISGSAGIGKSTLGIQFITEGCKRGEHGLYVALEEGPDQLLQTADALGLPLRKAIDDGFAEIFFCSHEHRAHQLLAVLTTKIQAQGTRRLVFDSVSQLAADLPRAELRHLLTALTARFRGLQVTSMLTLEAQALYSADRVTERGLSPVADNMIALRYEREAGVMRPTITVVKTRSSAHDWGTYYFAIGHGGVHLSTHVTKPTRGPSKSVVSAGDQMQLAGALNSVESAPNAKTRVNGKPKRRATKGVPSR